MPPRYSRRDVGAEADEITDAPDRWEQLYPESEGRLNREAEVIKPHLEWLTALPDELCIKVFGFLSKKQLHKVPHSPLLRRFAFL